MRIVLDTNILISACWKPGGLEEQVVELGLARRFIIAVSPALWAEYIEVLRRPKFKSIQPRVDLLIARLKPVVWKVEPVTTLTLATDPDDNRILECALAAKATYVVTGNLRDYPLDWPVARIVHARHFLADFTQLSFTATAEPQ